MTIEEILKDIDENRLTNPRVAVLRTLEAISGRDLLLLRNECRAAREMRDYAFLEGAPKTRTFTYDAARKASDDAGLKL